MREATVPDAAATAPKEERNWAMFCHVSGFAGYAFPLFGNVLAPLILWLLKREDSSLVDDQGKEAVNFQITWTIYFALSCLLVVALVGLLLVPVVFISHVALMIVATIKSSEGERYRYPATFRFID